MEPSIPIWAIFCKLMVRRAGKSTRVYIEIPTGLQARAQRLKAHLKAGRVEEGTLHVEGRALPGALRQLGFPSRIVDLTAALVELRGSPGVPTPISVLERRAELVEQLKTAVKEEKSRL